MKEDIVIVGVARTPFGSFQGTLSNVPAAKLGALAITAALERANLSPESVSEVIMGNVLSAGMGQAPARQAAIFAQIPYTAHCFTVNKVCGSGMKAIALGVQSLLLEESDIVVVGGMENMSQAPYLLPKAREGFRLGHQQLIDCMVHDGLWDPYGDKHMGQCAEQLAMREQITREAQDEYATESFKRAQKAQQSGKFQWEITPVEITTKKGILRIEQDEGPTKVQFEKIPNLRPAFDKEGTITAANASTINDGASACILMRKSTAEKKGIQPLACITSLAKHSHEPEWFTTAPVDAIKKALLKAHWKKEEVDLFEINEAFSVVPLHAQKVLGIDPAICNIWGGAIALGHPIGASGARIVTTLIAELKDQKKQRGLAAICIGGGEAMAICLEIL